MAFRRQPLHIFNERPRLDTGQPTRRKHRRQVVKTSCKTTNVVSQPSAGY